jgi:hypothetical protein
MQNVQENCLAKQVKSANLCLFNCQLNYISCERTKPVKCIRINKNLFLASNSKPQGCFSVCLSTFFLSFCLCLGFSLIFVSVCYFCMFISLFVCLFTFFISLSLSLSTYLFCLFVSLPISVSVCLSVSHFFSFSFSLTHIHT